MSCTCRNIKLAVFSLSKCSFLTLNELCHFINGVCNGRCDYGWLFHRAYETQDQNPIRNGTESHATAQLHPCEGEAE